MPARINRPRRSARGKRQWIIAENTRRLLNRFPLGRERFPSSEPTYEGTVLIDENGAVLIDENGAVLTEEPPLAALGEWAVGIYPYGQWTEESA